MKHNKIVSWFFILMMLSGLVLIFSPDSVRAAIDTVTFETGTLNAPYSDLFMTSQQHGSSGEHEVDNYNVYAGTKSFRTSTYGWWNLTLGDNEIVTKMKFKFFWGGDGGNDWIYVNMFNSQQYARGDITLWTQDSDSIITFIISSTATHVDYWDHNDALQDLSDRYSGVWTSFNITFNATDEVWYEYYLVSNGGVSLTGTPHNETAFQAGLSIDRITFNTQNNGCYLDIDNVVFTSYIPGTTTINVYNETSPSTAIPDWNIRVYDDDTVIQYSKNTLDNPVTINHTEYGTGNMFFEISATGYYNRTYYADIKTGVYYNLTAFLLHEDTEDAHIYTCIVVDDSDLDAILYINDATIIITRVINGSIHEVSSGFTDGSGRFYVPLIAGVAYNVNITADGYDDLRDTYIPSSTVFEHTFRMTSTSPTSTSYDDFWENISIDISMVSAGCMQDGNITITYLDSNSSTTNTEIRLFEIYGTTITLLNTWTNTSNSFFNVNSSINTTRVHYMSLYFNNTAFFTVSQPITIMILNVDSPFCDRVEPFDLDDRITDIVGPFTIDGHEVPWTFVIGSVIPIIVLVSFGPFNTGLGIIGCGLSMTMMQGFLDMYVTGGFRWDLVGIGAFIVILGILYIMTKGTGGDRL